MELKPCIMCQTEIYAGCPYNQAIIGLVYEWWCPFCDAADGGLFKDGAQELLNSPSCTTCPEYIRCLTISTITSADGR